jgi:hypothetical protein
VELIVNKDEDLREAAMYEVQRLGQEIEATPSKWVKLTETEIGELYRMGWKNNMDFARAIEFALEKKNGAYDELRECVKELFEKYLNRREESDSGRMFAPVQVSSVRVMLTEPLGELLEKMRLLSGAEKASDGY